ncbi:MAG: XdhC/CoxI family protein [Defluviitaleaceae bacterium]|nr:XdhC/CoxI family protein [Defluviitaleaceae bacterium]
MSANILKFAARGLESGRRVALAAVTDVSGSAPGTVGAMMAVCDDGTQAGTIGGGAVEHDVLTRIGLAFASGEGFEFDYDLGKGGGVGMVCGGRMKGYVSLLRPNRRLVIFGAGHIAQHVATLAAHLPFDQTVVDEREELRQSFADNVHFLAQTPAEAALSLTIDADTFIVIVNRSHALDNETLRLVLGKPAAYIGMMGSRAKIADTGAKLAAEGFSAEDLGRVYMPIGLGICDGTPMQIAFAIIAQILAVSNGADNIDVAKSRNST